MNPILREAMLKGLYLGLWAYLAIVQTPAAVDWHSFGRVIAWMSGGLALGLVAGAFVQIRRGYNPLANLKAFPLVVLLESPFWIYLGIVGGLGLGLVFEYDPPADRDWLLYCAVGGLVLGYGFVQLRGFTDALTRVLIALGVGGALVYLGISYLLEIPGFSTNEHRQTLGIVILSGLPFFYLLTFCGESEESEIEFAALCAALGIGLYQAFASFGTTMMGDKFVLLVPLMIYFVYVTRWLPKLRVFKHVLRGYSAMNLNRPVTGLMNFRRALALNPEDDLARAGMWELHQRLDVSKLPADSPVLQHIDYQFCLNQVQVMLMTSPSDETREKARRMLDLVERQQPAYAAWTDYLRALSQTHAKEFDTAAATLSKLLDPEVPYASASRDAVLFDAWNLAVRLHPELIKRLGEAELAKPGRRMQAIASVERKLATDLANDAIELKSLLYSGLTEAEFVADAKSGAPTEFNYDYVEQLGLALVSDPARRDRGMAFLRIAGRGLPERGVLIFSKLAELADAPEAARGYREQVKRAGQLVGVKGLNAEQRTLYFASVKWLAEDAESRGDYEHAIDNLRLMLESGNGELETYRKLAGLYEQHKDPLNALLMTETGLVYNSKDKDLLARKDKYYYSVEPERLAAVKDQVFRFFDVDYCAAKAKQIVDHPASDLDSLDWALHLSVLAKIIKPDSVPIRLNEARVRLRKGERDAALVLLEDIREEKPGGDEWYQAVKILADLYLNELDRPDLAVECYKAYRDYSKSGADTLFHIGRCYEAMNQPQNAVKFYEAVTGYEQHPKYWEAKEAVSRLKS